MHLLYYAFTNFKPHFINDGKNTESDIKNIFVCIVRMLRLLHKTTRNKSVSLHSYIDLPSTEEGREKFETPRPKLQRCRSSLDRP